MPQQRPHEKRGFWRRKRSIGFFKTLSIADRVAAAGIEPMSMEEIDAEVKAGRAERRQRASGP
jgi:hypothetical protein